MRHIDLLVIIALVIFWYGLVPIAGGFVSRHLWRLFRRRFEALRLKPQLTYTNYRQVGGNGETFRFIGYFESVDSHTLWIRGEDLTVPAALRGAHTYRLPMAHEDAPVFEPNAIPEKIRWDRVSVMTEEVKVFVGGSLVPRDSRYIFESTPEQPLLIIFYDGPDRSLPLRAISSGRHPNEYFNYVTPYAFILGAFSQILIAAAYLNRPAFRLTALVAFSALFTPLFPLIPPGLLFTLPYRELWWQARNYRAFRDLARLPLGHLIPGEKQGRLPEGEYYGFRSFKTLPPEVYEKNIPFIIPQAEKPKKSLWYIFGALPEPSSNDAKSSTESLPEAPQDPFAVFGVLPGESRVLAQNYSFKGLLYGIIAWILLLAGIGLNVFFAAAILSLFYQ